MFYIPDCMRKPSPKSFPKPPGAMAGQSGKRGRFFPRRGPALPLCTNAFLQRGGPLSFPQSRIGRGHKTPASLQKVGALSIISRLHGKSQPKGFRKPPGARVEQPPKRRRFILRQGPPLLLCTGAFLQRGGPVIPPIPQGMGNTKVPTEEKGGSSVLYSRLHENPNPKGFPKLPGAMAGQSGKRGRFFPRRGIALPLCTGAFFRRGGPVLLPNPAGNGKHKSSHFFCKRWE